MLIHSKVLFGSVQHTAYRLFSHSHKSKHFIMELKPKVVFFLGGPGSGKGTQSALIEKKYGYRHLSAGDLLREERKSGSKDGELIESFIKQGKIVPSSITVTLLHNAMKKVGLENGKFLIDGFPRNKENYQSWNAQMQQIVEIPFILTLLCDEECMLERLLERGKSSGRSDDNAESIKKRFITAKEETQPVLEIFRNQGKLVEINSQRDINSIFEEISKHFDKI